MRKTAYATKAAMGAAAADDAAARVRGAIRDRGAAHVILATGASQFEFLAALAAAPGVDWPQVTMFHLDEYLGMDATHPASFVKYLRERFVQKVPGLKASHFLDGTNPDPQAECRRVGGILLRHPVDVACVGIGENGHLAFNDPPADFATEAPYLVVDLDAACRRQQFGEGWFKTLEDVPRRAMSMSIRQILKSRALVVTVPDARKAQALKGSLEGPVTPQVPASILQTHPDCAVYMDAPAAALLSAYDRG